MCLHVCRCRAHTAAAGKRQQLQARLKEMEQQLQAHKNKHHSIKLALAGLQQRDTQHVASSSDTQHSMAAITTGVVLPDGCW